MVQKVHTNTKGELMNRWKEYEAGKLKPGEVGR